MFTGIITHIGKVAQIEKSGDWRLRIAVPAFTHDVVTGASISCSGTCLTVIEKDADSFTVQVSAETRAKTTIGEWIEGAYVNLERALKVGDELGGHFVSGHIDGLAVLKKMQDRGESRIMGFSFHSRAVGDDNLIYFIAPKGSVTLDGVSLTVNEVSERGFTVNVIPHTLTHTTLGERKPGDMVNLEIDLIARYLARLKGNTHVA